MWWIVCAHSLWIANASFLQQFPLAMTQAVPRVTVRCTILIWSSPSTARLQQPCGPHSYRRESNSDRRKYVVVFHPISRLQGAARAQLGEERRIAVIW